MNLDNVRAFLDSELINLQNDFLNSEEGKESLKIFQERLKKHSDRWIEKFKDRAGDDIDSLLEILINKYDSEEYVDRELHSRLRGEPRDPFLWVAVGYAKKYGKECKDEKYFNPCTINAYYIGSYVIQVIHAKNDPESGIFIDKIEN